MTSRSSVVLCAALGALWLACTRDNPDFCCTTAESCGAVGVSTLAPCRSAGSRPYCDDTGQFGAAHTCIVDPSAPACERTEDCTTPERPVCDSGDSGTCIGCADADDCTRFPGRAVCAASGACVECTASEQCLAVDRPICNAAGTCEACTADAQCASGLCDEGAGSCIGEDDIIYVAGTGSGTACSRMAPCATLGDGVAAITATRRFMLVAAGDYQEPTIMLDGKTVTIVGPGAAVRPSAFDVPVMLVLNASTVRLEGIRLHSAGVNNNADGIRCAAPTAGTPLLTLDGVRIDGNAGFGIDASSCTVTIRRSTIAANPGGGVSILDGSFDITNSFITGNGGATTGVGGARLMNNATTSVFEFNTVADNTASAGIAAALSCSAAQQRIANNILSGSGATQVSSTNCTLEFNLSNQGLGGSGNVTASPQFVSGTDYHLMLSSEGVDDADPDATMPTDFDGQARPQGTRRDIGADEVVP